MFSWTKIYVRHLPTNSRYFLQIQRYGRWVYRKPNRILLPQQYEETQEPRNDKSDGERKEADIQWRHATPVEKEEGGKKYGSRGSSFKKNIKKDAFDMLQTIIDSNGELVYTKLPDKDARVTTLLTSAQSNTLRDKKNILLEGKRLIKEALQSNCKLEYLLFSRKSDVEDMKSLLPKTGATLYKMPYREIQLWSGLTTTPGIMGIFRRPDLENVTPPADSIPLTVICDNIREPGNLGSILRTCAGAGCQKIILTKGCVNLWDAKVTRSASGAHFRLKIVTKSDWSQVEEEIGKNNIIFMADNKLISSSNKNLGDITYEIESIPLIPYYGIYVNRSDSLVLIIGGETEGLSENAYNFIRDRKGARLNIPMTSDIDCLNTGVALGIILFEMKKQMLLNVGENKSRIQNVG